MAAPCVAIVVTRYEHSLENFTVMHHLACALILLRIYGDGLLQTAWAETGSATTAGFSILSGLYVRVSAATGSERSVRKVYTQPC
jgi:hypothetical protein